MENRAMKILILDDDPFMIQLMATMLERLGYDHINTAVRGADALECISRADGAPDLVLCDLIMPEMDGLEFARNLVTQRFNGALIIVSGADHRILESTEKLLQAHSIRVLGRLHKPFNKDELKTLLDRWSPPPEPAGTSRRKVYSPEEIRRAIDNRELISYYQPKVEVATGRVLGMESLARWRHPEDGLVFPDQFIGVAEESGLIDDLTRLVLTNSLSTARAWNDAGLGIGVAVNISMDNLKTLDFPGFIDKKLDEAGVSPDQVTLEITESRLMENHLLSIEVLTRLRLKGFALSIDDFGTGNSTLAQLRDIPFSEMKIDRGFVHEACCANATIRAIYHASLDLATQLGMSVVAEGVEDAEDWDFLKKTGCHMAQGYFIARPMPENRISEWLASWHERLVTDNIV